MSVVRLSPPGSALEQPDVYNNGEVPRRCSYCDQMLRRRRMLEFEPVVHWNAAGVKLWLHADCAKGLALCLLFDAERALRIVSGQSPLDGLDPVYRPPGPQAK